jgi:hypothetical protein
VNRWRGNERKMIERIHLTIYIDQYLHELTLIEIKTFDAETNVEKYSTNYDAPQHDFKDGIIEKLNNILKEKTVVELTISFCNESLPINTIRQIANTIAKKFNIRITGGRLRKAEQEPDHRDHAEYYYHGKLEQPTSTRRKREPRGNAQIVGP